MDVNLAREFVTVASFLVFIGIVAWAASPANRGRFDEAARVPLDDDEPTLSPALDPLPNPLPREREQTRDTVSRNGSVRR